MIRQIGAIGLLAAGTAAGAQTSPAPPPLRERTGPNALPERLPGFAAPAPGLASPTPGAPASGSGTATFSDVIVEGAVGGAFRPPKQWRPSTGAEGEPELERPGAAGFDAAWMRRQFVEKGLIGVPVPLDRVVALVHLINLALARNGYVNSGLRIAPGAVVDGQPLRLKLVTGRLSAPVAVTWGAGGAKGLSESFIRNRMPSATAEPLDVLALERDFRLLAENRAIRTVDADLRPGAAAGEALLALTVEPASRFDAYLTVANSRSPTIGGVREAIGASLRNAIVPGDLLSAEAGRTSGRSDYVVGYEGAFLSPKTRISLRGGRNNAAATDRPLRPLNIRAQDRTIEGGLSRLVVQRPLTPRPSGGSAAARTVALGFRIAHRRSQTSLGGQPLSFSPGSVEGRAEYTAARLTADWVERGAAQVIALSLTATQGLDGTHGDLPELPQPDPQFRSVLGQFSLARRLLPNGLELHLRLTGQYADGILYSGERFSAGGEYTVRGYRETLALADTGVVGSVELAQPFSLTGGQRRRNGADLGFFSLCLCRCSGAA